MNQYNDLNHAIMATKKNLDLTISKVAYLQNKRDEYSTRLKMLLRRRNDENDENRCELLP